MNASRVSIFQNDNLLHANRDNDLFFVSFGSPVGKIGNAQCFESIVIRDRAGRQHTITQRSYGGGVSVCIRYGKGVREWFGICDAQTVVARNQAQTVEG